MTFQVPTIKRSKASGESDTDPSDVPTLKKIENAIFSLFYEINRDTSVFSILFYLYMIIDAVQMLRFPLHPAKAMPWSLQPMAKSMFTLFQPIWFQATPVPSPSDTVVDAQTVFSLAVAWSGLFIGLFLASVYIYSRTDDLINGTVAYKPIWPLRYLRMASRVTIHALFIPIFQSLLSPFTCTTGELWANTDVQCFGSTHSLFIALAVILTPLLFILCILFALLNINRFPDPKWNPLSQPHGHVTTAMVAVKAILCLVYVFGMIGLPIEPIFPGEPYFNTVILLLCIALLGGIAWLLLYCYFLPYHSQKFNDIQCIFAGIYIAASIASLLSLSTPKQRDSSLGVWVFLFIFPLAAFVSWALAWVMIRIHTNQREINNPYSIELRARFMIRQAGGVLDMSNRVVKKQRQELRTREPAEDTEALLNIGADKSGTKKSGSKRNDISRRPGADENDDDRDAKIRETQIFLEDSLKVLSGSALLESFVAEFFAYASPNRHLELLHLRNILQKADTTAIDVRFYVWERHSAHQEEETHSRTVKTSVVRRMQFDKLQTESENLTMRGRNAILDFWTEASERRPDMIRLESLGVEIITCIRQADNCYRQLLEFAPQSTSVMRKYADFLLEVANNPKKAIDLLHQAEQTEEDESKSHSDSAANDIRFMTFASDFDLSNESVSLVRMDAHPDRLGVVLEANPAACKLFGYLRRELIGQNINELVPAPMDAFHQRWLERYMETGVEYVVNTSRMYFALSKDKVLLPLKGNIRPMDGAFGGVFEEQRTSQGFLFFLGPIAKWRVTSACKISQSLLGIKPNDLDAGAVTMDRLLPHIFYDDYEEIEDDEYRMYLEQVNQYYYAIRESMKDALSSSLLHTPPSLGAPPYTRRSSLSSVGAVGALGALGGVHGSSRSPQVSLARSGSISNIPPLNMSSLGPPSGMASSSNPATGTAAQHLANIFGLPPVNGTQAPFLRKDRSFWHLLPNFPTRDHDYFTSALIDELLTSDTLAGQGVDVRFRVLPWSSLAVAQGRAQRKARRMNALERGEQTHHVSIPGDIGGLTGKDGIFNPKEEEAEGWKHTATLLQPLRYVWATAKLQEVYLSLLPTPLYVLRWRVSRTDPGPDYEADLDIHPGSGAMRNRNNEDDGDDESVDSNEAARSDCSSGSGEQRPRNSVGPYKRAEPGARPLPVIGGCPGLSAGITEVPANHPNALFIHDHPVLAAARKTQAAAREASAAGSNPDIGVDSSITKVQVIDSMKRRDDLDDDETAEAMLFSLLDDTDTNTGFGTGKGPTPSMESPGANGLPSLQLSELQAPGTIQRESIASKGHKRTSSLSKAAEPSKPLKSALSSAPQDVDGPNTPKRGVRWDDKTKGVPLNAQSTIVSHLQNKQLEPHSEMPHEVTPLSSLPSLDNASSGIPPRRNSTQLLASHGAKRNSQTSLLLQSSSAGSFHPQPEPGQFTYKKDPDNIFSDDQSTSIVASQTSQSYNSDGLERNSSVYAGEKLPKGEGASVYSAGSSVASGMTDALRRGINSNNRAMEGTLIALKRSIMLVFVIIGLMNIASLSVTYAFFSSLLSELEVVALHGRRGITLQQVYGDVQYLSLIADNVVDSTNPRAVSLAERLGDNLSILAELHQLLYSGAQEGNEAERSLNADPLIPVKDLVPGKYVSRMNWDYTVRHVNLLNGGLELIAKSHQVLARDPMDNHVSESTGTVLWVLENGPGPIRRAMNESMIIAQSKTWGRDNALVLANHVVLAISLALLLIVTGLFMMPAIIRVLHQKVRVFEVFLHTPMAILRSLRAQCETKLHAILRANEEAEAGMDVGGAGDANVDDGFAPDETQGFDGADGYYKSQHGDSDGNYGGPGGASSRSPFGDGGGGYDSATPLGQGSFRSPGSSAITDTALAAVSASTRSHRKSRRQRPRAFRRRASLGLRAVFELIWPILALSAYYVGTWWWKWDTAQQSEFGRNELFEAHQIEFMIGQAGFNVRNAISTCDHDVIIDQYDKFQKLIATLDERQDALMTGSVIRHVRPLLKHSQSHFRLFMKDGCIENGDVRYTLEECYENFSDGIVGRGLQAAYKHYLQLIREAMEARYLLTEVDPALCSVVDIDQGIPDTIERLAYDFLALGFEHSSNIATENITNLLRNHLNLNIIATIASILSLAVFHMAVYSPLVKRLDVEIKNVRYLLLLFPDEISRVVPAIVSIGRELLKDSQSTTSSNSSG